MSEQPTTYLTTAGALGTHVVREYKPALIQQIRLRLLTRGKQSYAQLHQVLGEKWGNDPLTRHLTMLEHTGQIVAHRRFYGAPAPGPMYRGYYWVYQMPPGVQ